MGVFYENFVKRCNQIKKAPSAAALEMGLSKTAVSNWKNRHTTPTDANKQVIAEYFGISVAELMAEDEKKPAPNDGNGQNMYDEKLLMWFRALSEEKRRAILALGDAPEELRGE